MVKKKWFDLSGAFRKVEVSHSGNSKKRGNDKIEEDEDPSPTITVHEPTTGPSENPQNVQVSLFQGASYVTIDGSPVFNAVGRDLNLTVHHHHYSPTPSVDSQQPSRSRSPSPISPSSSTTANNVSGMKGSSISLPVKKAESSPTHDYTIANMTGFSGQPSSLGPQFSRPQFLRSITAPILDDRMDENGLSRTSTRQKMQKRRVDWMEEYPSPGSTDSPTLTATPPQSPVRSTYSSQKYRNEDGTYRTFVERLKDKLGIDYNGAEKYRLDQDYRKAKHWKRWGPYLSDRQWATVREDYSADGDAWSHFPHAHARSRAYRWGEDGIAGISDNHQRLCFGLSLWNGEDPILKERLFGVTGHQGNHGEDCKELYYYLDSTPTHSYMKFLYKYPQRRYPYEELVSKNQKRGRDVPEYELLDTDVFDEDRYWDVFVEYAKDEQDPENLYIRITAYNRGPDPATLHIIPQLWFPNTWSWSLVKPHVMPSMNGSIRGSDNTRCISVHHATLGRTHLYCLPSPPPVGPNDNGEVDLETDALQPDLMFTDNNTNFSRLYGDTNETSHVKDAFHDHIIPSHRPPAGILCFVNPEQRGTKSGAHYVFRDVPGRGGCSVVRLKLTPSHIHQDNSLSDEGIFDDAIEERRQEADEFYSSLVSSPLSDDLRQITRQAFSGMLWSKQYYRFNQKQWMEGDPTRIKPKRNSVRNREWRNMDIKGIISVPDKWEYPFFTAWHTAFHCIPLAVVDPGYAKQQLDLLTKEWYMKLDGQIPASEWNFSHVNPPVHAWAAFRIFKIERKLHGREDLSFLETVFQKLASNFSWWINRKDQDGRNIFEGGFLGMDNIGVFNRSAPLPTGGTLRQADGTAWMAFYCLNMLSIALELAKHNPVHESNASKYFEHFILIADAMTYPEQEYDQSLWNEEDGMYYDAILLGSIHSMHLPVRSLVGLIPLYGTLVLEPATLNRFPGFKRRVESFIENRPELLERNTANMKVSGNRQRRLLALASKERLVKILEKMLDENEFLSEHGIRSLSKYHAENPWGMDVHGQRYEVNYCPGDSDSSMFGGNTNWRGPIWLSINHLLIESLQRFYQYYGDDLQVECPTGSGEYLNLVQVAEEIQHRIIHLFVRNVEGRRATNGGNDKLDFDPHFRDYVSFHESFHADNGRGLGASHHTGWSALVAYHILQVGVTCRLPRTPRTPGSILRHYFDEALDSRGESDYYSDVTNSFKTACSQYDNLETLGDISPDAL